VKRSETKLFFSENLKNFDTKRFASLRASSVCKSFITQTDDSKLSFLPFSPRFMIQPKAEWQSAIRAFFFTIYR